MNNPDIAFRPARAEDLPILAAWLARPHWREWWGASEDELSMIRDMIEGRDPAEPYLIEMDGEPVGYIQSWRVADILDSGLGEDHPWLSSLPPEAVGIDLSLADSGTLGKGLGSTVVKRFVRRLYAKGHRIIVIDPAANNHRAIGAYRKAGFVAVPRVKDCPNDIHIMVHGPSNHHLILTDNKTRLA
ncbi:GNAT family N-acetyltransferase [Notoacmeibacter marinus]|uniref:GNAT family N-acetyltransferase n=1 Tax=Notoacmeibacter marinus TaxID=1876515 RepID=UPI000DF206A8|nr:GNAT family N-acetyltransferase [Notoacmeibacter marinus]